MEFPLFNTKELSDGKTYDINDPAERRKYFEVKLGKKIDELKEYLDNDTFVAFLLAKKSSGKGTYSKMVMEVLGEDRVACISVGDIVRNVHKEIQNKENKDILIEYLRGNYRGFMTVEDTISALEGRSQDKLLPTEFILTLVKREIEKVGRKALFIDGLPRETDQVSYSLFFRDLINFRDDPDFFILINCPEAVIDERMRFRVVCPRCNTPRNIKLLPTKTVEYDNTTQEFYLVCDNPSCEGNGKERMVRKEGDDKGIELIRNRLDKDQRLMELVSSVEGIPVIKLRNSLSVSVANSYADSYELTPEYSYKVNDKGEVEIAEKPWTIKDDDGVESHSLMAPAVVVSLLDQMHKLLIG